MDKFIQIGEKFGLEGEKLLEFVREQQKLEEERRREEEEKEEKRRQLEEEKEEKRRKLEEERRREEEEKEEKRRQLEEEREEKRRQLEEEKEERRRILEEDRRKEEEEKEERRRREDEEKTKFTFPRLMLIIAQVLKEKWFKITGFAHSQTTNKLMNEATNDSARVSGQDRKKTARSRNQSNCRIWRTPPVRKLGKI